MKNNKDDNIIVIDLREMIYLLLHKAWIIILVTVIGSIGTYLVSKYLITPIYTSSTKVFVINRQEENRTTFSDLQMGAQLTKDFSILVRGRQVLMQVIDNFDLDIDYEEFTELVEVNTPDDTRVLEIKVSYDDPELARLLADAITELSSEKMVDIMDMKKVNVLEAAYLPTEPSSPNIIKNTVIGCLIGLTLTSIIFIVNHLFNDTIENSDDVENYLNITVLGIIPLEESTMRKRKRKRIRALREKNRVVELEENTYATN
ncbi:MAG TPA: hypothetical protein GX731_08010 [Clostridiales bacterium]|nr:hypothetical protein [Clostridiales bacterium]